MSRILAWVLVLAAGAIPVQAERGTDPAALKALRHRYQTLLTEAEGPSRKRWMAAIEALEKQKAAEGDYAGAAEVRARRVQTAASVAAPVAASVRLSAGNASTSTAVDQVDASKGVVRFRRTGALMEWELPGQQPGVYEVHLICGVNGKPDENDNPDPLEDPKIALPQRDPATVTDTMAGGVVEFREVTNLKSDGVLLRKSVRPTGGWTATRSIPLGRVKLDSKIVKFSLRAVDALPAGVMDFHRIELTPVSKAAPVPSGTTDPAGRQEFVRLREIYLKQFSDQTRAITAKYLRSLTEWEAAAGRSRDNETLALVRQEKKRVESGGQPETTGEGAGGLVLPVTEKLYFMYRGEARITSQDDYLTRMRPADSCEATWKLAGFGVASGTYTVEVECRMTSEHGGKAVLSTSTPGGPAGPELAFEVKQTYFPPGRTTAKRKPDGTPGESVTKTLKIGKLIIPKGSQYLTLRVTRLDLDDGGLFDLKSLRLTPVPPEKS